MAPQAFASGAKVLVVQHTGALSVCSCLTAESGACFALPSLHPTVAQYVFVHVF